MEHSLFPFGTDFQCVLESREQLPQLRRLFRPLHQEGFYKGESNLPDLNLIKPEELKSLLNKYQMKVNMLATGVYAKTRDLSLSSGIPGERIRAVSGCKRNTDYTASMGCGTIIGFLKGDPNGDSESAERLFLEFMLKLKPYNRRKKNAGSH